jgi:hypothetical protein
LLLVDTVLKLALGRFHTVRDESASSRKLSGADRVLATSVLRIATSEKWSSQALAMTAISTASTSAGDQYV